MMRRLGVVGPLACAAHLVLQCATSQAGVPVDYLYPDMFPYVDVNAPANLQSLQAWQLSGTTLKFSTLFANQGDGLFEIRKGAPVSATRYELLQRVYINTDFGAQFEDISIGTSPIPGTAGSPNPNDTNVIWFEDFTRFSLLEAPVVDGVLTVGDELTFSEKTSWRLSSGQRLPSYSTPNYVSPDQTVQQRVSVGWADLYGAGSSGQSLDIAGIPAGPLYWLRQTVDPENRIHETDETNNSYEVLIDLNHPGEAVTFAGEFVRPGDPLPPAPGDLNEDGMIDINDWAAFKASASTSLAGLSKADAYVLGDLNLDGVHSLQDVVLFRQYYDQAHGAGSFASLQSVPEPTGLMILSAAGLILVVAVRPFRRRRQLLLISLTILAFMGSTFTPDTSAGSTLYKQDFEGLSLGPNVDEMQYPNSHAWTDTPPPGWSVDDSGVPFLTSSTRGVTEWKGWSFTDKAWWALSAGDQGRANFTLGQGTVAVADPDEWDDKGGPITSAPFGGYYKALMTTPAISLFDVAPGTAKLRFDSSWLPECCDDGPSRTNNQTATVRVSYDGGTNYSQVLRWESNSASPSYKPGATNETVTLDLQNPAGASSVKVEFGLSNAGNDWWWAIDNLELFTPTTLEVDATTGQMTIEGASDLTGYEIKSAGGSLDPAGWRAGNLDKQNLGPTSPLTADFNNDNVVDVADYTVWRDHFGASDQGDANADGVTDQDDYLLWKQQFGHSIAEGDSWETLNSSNKQLLEFYLSGSSTFASRSIGRGYDTSIDAKDLSFTYSSANGSEAVGLVRYVTSAAGQGASAVPEPASWAMLLGALAASCFLRQ
jgi:Lysyl oxidase